MLSARSWASLPLPAELMEPGSKVQGISQTKGVRQLLGQGECLLASLQGLVRIAKIPQGPGHIDKQITPGSCPCREARERCLLRVIEGNPLLQVLSGRGKLSEAE